MVEVKKDIRKDKTYFYLAHSYREGKRVLKKQLYLGNEIPKDIEEKKENFMKEFYREKFLNDIEKIKSNFNKEYKKMPISAKKKFLEGFGIKFTYNTQRIEGSTLSLKDTAKLLEDGITPASKPLEDIKEAEAHKKIFEEMMDYKEDLKLQLMSSWNKTLLEQTKPDIAGKVRDHQVRIARSKFVPPLAIEIEYLLREFFKWYNTNKNKIHPVELAALVHLKFVTIHPFGDGNGRISRLMMNFVLKKYNFPMLDIPYTKRESYYNALERSNIKNDNSIFVQWLFRRYLGEHKEYLKKE